MYLTLAQLDKLPTHRLLAYKKKLNKISYSDECRWYGIQNEDDKLLFKAKNDVSSILSKRGHCEKTRGHIYKETIEKKPSVEFGKMIDGSIYVLSEDWD